MKLKLEHLAPYLPYKLMFLTPRHRFKYGTQESLLMTGLSINLGELDIEFFRDNDLEFSNTMKWVKPILYPLSYLSKEIEVNGEKFRPFEKLDHNFELQNNSHLCLVLHGARIINLFDHPYKIMQKLFEWHFDVFGLINEGLAIDKTRIK